MERGIMEEKGMKKYFGIGIATLLFVLQAMLLPRTGMTWDEPSSFFFGRANLKFWMTGDRRYVTDFKNKALFKNDPIQYIYGEDVYPPFPFLVASTFSYVLSEKLHILNTIDAHHLGEVAIGAIGVGFFYYLLLELGMAVPVAALTTAMYALYPTIFGQMRSDAKDIPLMSMLVITVYWFVRWVKNNSQFVIRNSLFFIFSFGLALATKPTAAILVPIFILWMCIKKRGVLIKFLVLGSLSLVVMFIVWPWLWDNPVGKLQEVWQFFKVVGYQLPVLYLGKLYAAGVDLPKEYPFAILLFQTPIEISVLFLVGTIIAFKKPWGFLVLIWFWFGMSRFFVPGVLIYAKVRHFIDVMPAFFILAGYGLSFFHKLLKLPKLLKCLIIGLILIHELIIITRLFPYEPSYFNALIGGARGVSEKHLFDIEYWGSGVKEAMEYINANDPEARVYACGLRHVAQLYEKGSVRVALDGSEATTVILPNSPSFFGPALDFHKKNDTIVHTVVRDGAELYFVFKRTSPAWYTCGYETESNYPLSYLPSVQRIR